MQKRSLLLWLFIGSLLPLAAQDHPSCEGLRYRADVFTDVEVTMGVVFGANSTIGGNAGDLLMDVYEPAGDDAETRPAVVLAFGGGFVTGERQDLEEVCRSFARKGYVAITIDYRLFDLFIPVDSNQIHDVVVKAIGDMKAAIRYLRQDADTENQFRIDAELIFAGGISAGAIVASHVAHLDEGDEIPNYLANIISNNGGLEGNSSDNFEYSSSVAGLVNYSGALKSAAFVDAGSPPQFSVHDEGDGVVVYGNGLVSAGPIVFVYLEGSSSMHQQALEVGASSELITVPGNGHVSYFFNNAGQYEDEVESRTAEFLAQLVCGELSNTGGPSFAPFELRAYPNPLAGDADLQLELPSETGRFSLKLSAPDGRVVLQKEGLSGAAVSLSLPALPAGLYFLSVQLDDAAAATVHRRILVY